MKEALTEIDPSLIRKLLFMEDTNQIETKTTKTAKTTTKITQDALQAIGELIRQFIIETRYRASIEAEFEYEMNNNSNRMMTTKRQKIRKRKMNDDDNNNGDNNNKNDNNKNDNNKNDNDDEKSHDNNDNICYIQPKHLLKVSAEILMDFS